MFEKSYTLKDDEIKEEPKLNKDKRKMKQEEEADTFKNVKRKTSMKNRSMIMGNNRKNKLKFDELPDFFHGKHFYVSYGDYNDSTLLDIARIILAYDGILETKITLDVEYAITDRPWNQDFEKVKLKLCSFLEMLQLELRE